MAQLQLGLGLIGIGKRWGYVDPSVPDESSAIHLLESAYSLGIRYFDTAPSYGVSEERLGRFLRTLSATERRQIEVATKFGEHWDFERQEPFVDHSFDALKRSIDGSIERIGLPDALQLHKTTPDVLRSDALARAWEYAHLAGIPTLGASVSDLVSADIVLADSQYRLMQLPFNADNRKFEPVIRRAADQQVRVAINRPFGMGKLIHDQGAITQREAFAFVLGAQFVGVVLTGTKSVEHLRANVAAFREAVQLTIP